MALFFSFYFGGSGDTRLGHLFLNAVKQRFVGRFFDFCFAIHNVNLKPAGELILPALQAPPPLQWSQEPPLSRLGDERSSDARVALLAIRTQRCTHYR